MNDLKDQERLFDLLTEREIYGLDEEKQRELKQLLKTYPEWEDDETFAMTATAIALSAVKTDEPMPDSLRSKILADSERFFSSQEYSGKVLDFKSKNNRKSPIENDAAINLEREQRRMSFWNWAGWVAAAAACVALAINLWTTRKPNEIVQTPPVQQNSPTPPPSLAEQRQQLLAAAPDAVRASWTDFNPKKPFNVQGDVVWSNSLQKGYIRFQNLPVNDKTRETYQLWIFDANQNAKTPVDGGVFDVDENGEVIVPIDAKIQVGKPTMFAVTAEKPGGVVVSELGKVMAVAKVQT
ncbi:MAG TPA: anti-sigma factor [Pyrinomonadaceae bacterium]|jgi:anti-sigma-K factor RskA